jgi:nucleotide-binding universal stress UspA family protein/predicted transcriptional regulator
MPFPYRRILCPIDFDENSLSALSTAAEIAREHDGTVYVLHVVPLIVQPTAMPVYVDLYKGQAEAAHHKLLEIARRRLAGLKYELMTQVGEPSGAILKAARKTHADVIVMATHGRRGFKHFFLGSIAEIVLREANCPVLTTRHEQPDRDRVRTWMTGNPIVAAPGDKLSEIENKMIEGGFRSVPIVKDGKPVGIVTDRDVRGHTGHLDSVEAFKAMTQQLITVTPDSSIREAARLLRERKIGALPVIEDGVLTGIITTTDVLEALAGDEAAVSDGELSG